MNENQSRDFGIKNFIRLLIRQFGVIVGVNLLMTLTMITILGIPASFAAGASVFIKLFRDEPCQVRDQYFGVFKREFTRSLATGSAVLLMIPLALYAASVYYRVSAGNPLLTTAAVVCLSIAIVWLIASFYLWVNLATVDLPVRTLFKNSLRMAFLRPAQNMLAVFATLIIVYIYGRNLPLSVVCVPFFSYGLTLFVSSYVAYAGVRKYALIEEERDKDEENDSFYLKR